MNYKVEIRETLSRIIDIEAENESEAIIKVKEKYRKENIILDQFLLPFNLHRIDNYFDNELKVIVVERDPRDVFLVNKYVWINNNVEIPIPIEVNAFCKYYKKMRESEISSNSNKILRLKFEDLVYKYESTLEIIMKFLDFKKSDHIYKKTKFIPEISIKNTQIFKNENYKAEVEIIEKELSEYLYQFPTK